MQFGVAPRFLHRAFVGLALSFLLQPLGHAIDELCAPSGDYHALAMSSGLFGNSSGLRDMSTDRGIHGM